MIPAGLTYGSTWAAGIHRTVCPNVYSSR
jgi:hypothetical protein